MTQIKSLKTGIKFKDTPIGKIPVDWEANRLGELCIGKAEYGANAPAVERDNNLPRYVRITDINDNGRLLTSTWQSIDRKVAEPYILRKGDFLFARSGATVGKTYLYRTADGECAFAGYLIRFRPDPSKLLPDLLFHFTHSNAYYQWVKGMLRAGAQPNINGKEYSDLILPLPPLPEQKKIAEILTTVDDAIEETDRIIEKTKELKKGLMQKLLTRGIGHKKFKKTAIGKIPEEWEAGLFSAIAEINPKRNLKSGNVYPFVEMAAISSESHGVQYSIPRKFEGGGSKFQKKDTIFARITPCTENGKTAYVDFLKDNEFGHGSTEFIILGPKENVAAKFIYYCAKWEKVRNIAISKMEGTSGRQRVPSRVFSEDIYVPLPPLPEQIKIAEILTTVDEAIAEEEVKKYNLESLKKSLMQVLLTGRVRVKLQ